MALDNTDQPFTLAAEGRLFSVLASKGKTGRTCSSPIQAKIATARNKKVDRQQNQGLHPDSQSSKRELLSLLLGPREGLGSRDAVVGGEVGLSGRLRGVGGPARGE